MNALSSRDLSSPERISRHLEEEERSKIRSNLFISDDSDENQFREGPKKQRIDSPSDVSDDEDTETFKIQNKHLISFVEEMVIFKAIDKRCPKKKQAEVQEWVLFFLDLVKEFQRKKNFGRVKTEKLRKGSKEITYGARMNLFYFLGRKLFGVECFAEVVALFLDYHGAPFVKEVNAINEKVGVESVNIAPTCLTITCPDLLDVHFQGKGSYTHQFAIFSSLNNKFPKGTFNFPTKTELVIHKRSLCVPQIKRFTNTNGETIGRVCDFMELIKFQFGNRDIVNQCDFFMADSEVPRAIVLNHTDGARQSLVIELVSMLLRLLNLKDIARNPASQLILALEQSHESTELFDLLFNACGINEALEELQKHGLDVICVGEPCQLCSKGISCFQKMGPYGAEEFFHSVEFIFLYVWDRKAHNRKLGLRDNYCQSCHTVLGKESYRDMRTKACHQATLEDFIVADKIYRKYIEEYRCKMEHRKPATIHEVDRDDFKNSPQYLLKLYQKEAGMQYNGFCVDQVTPLAHHLTGTLHAEIHIAEFLVELGYVCAEAVEEKHPGLGVHAFTQSLRFASAGVPHGAERIKHYCHSFEGHFDRVQEMDCKRQGPSATSY